MDGIGDIGEVAAVAAITVDGGACSFDECLAEDGDDGGIGVVRVLIGTEDVEIAEADIVEAIGLVENVGIVLGGQFADGIGRQGFADPVLYLW